jgi:hypothetical protein
MLQKFWRQNVRPKYVWNDRKAAGMNERKLGRGKNWPWRGWTKKKLRRKFKNGKIEERKEGGRGKGKLNHNQRKLIKCEYLLIFSSVFFILF